MSGVRVNIPALREALANPAQHTNFAPEPDVVLALVEAVELGNELRLWEPGRAGWAAAFSQFTDALAVFEFDKAVT